MSLPKLYLRDPLPASSSERSVPCYADESDRVASLYIRPNTDEWLAFRRDRVLLSSTAAVDYAGVGYTAVSNPGHLWERARARESRLPFTEPPVSPFVQRIFDRGHEAEARVLAGWRCPGTHQQIHPLWKDVGPVRAPAPYHMFSATPDALVGLVGGRVFPVEVKSVTTAKRLWEAPHGNHLAQVALQMMCLSDDAAVVPGAFLHYTMQLPGAVGSGFEDRVYELERSKQFETDVAEMALRGWRLMASSATKREALARFLPHKREMEKICERYRYGYVLQHGKPAWALLSAGEKAQNAEGDQNA